MINDDDAHIGNGDGDRRWRWRQGCRMVREAIATVGERSHRQASTGRGASVRRRVDIGNGIFQVLAVGTMKVGPEADRHLKLVVRDDCAVHVVMVANQTIVQSQVQVRS